MAPAGIEPGGQQRAHAHRDKPPLPAPGNNHQAHERRQAKAGEGHCEHHARAHGAAAGEAGRAGAVIVGAADAIGIVIREIHADLQQ